MSGFGAGAALAVNQIEAGEGCFPEEINEALHGMAETYGVSQSEMEEWRKDWETLVDDIIVRIIPPTGPVQ